MLTKQDLLAELSSLEPLLSQLSTQLWGNPEVSGTEKASSDLLRKTLSNEGFSIINSKKLPYGFYAEYGNGTPCIAIIGEYDALPKLSQKVSVKKEPECVGAAGHGCGHNLIGSASAVAAIAIKRLLKKEGLSGTVRYYGCPQEELLDGKVQMIAEGMFNGCDAALTWHPMDSTLVHDRAYLANTSMRFYFHGRTSHAAFAPERGRSALDAVELMNVGVNYLREHVIDKTRIHYTTDSCGIAPNIVPDNANSWYFIRAPHMSDVKDVATRVELCAKGAAIMTETTVDIKHGFGCCEFKENNAFANLIYANMIQTECPVYSQDEIEFATKLQATVDAAIVSKNHLLYAQDTAMFSGVGERELWKQCEMTASSDTGDLSFVMPAGLFTVASWPIGVSPHTWQSASCAGSSIGTKSAFYAAKIIAMSAYDLYSNPNALETVKDEFAKRDDGKYAPSLADE